MNFREFFAKTDDDGRRIDRVLRIFLPELQLSEIYGAIRKGFVKVNEKKIKCDERIHFGDKIKIAEFLFDKKNLKIQKAQDSKITKEYEEKNLVKFKMNEKEILIKIIYEDKNFLMIDKPYDILVHGKNSLEQILPFLVKEKDSLSFKTGALHRLDKKTTGILVISKTTEGARWFSEKLKNHEIKKTYVSVVEGKITNEEKWTDFISKDENNKNYFKTVKVHSKQDEKSKIAITKIIPVCYGKIGQKQISLVKFEIETGRTHQIRSQSFFHNHCIFGDTAYGGTNSGKKQNREFFLHAYKLNFGKNSMNIPEEITCPLPDDFYDFIRKNFKNFYKF